MVLGHKLQVESRYACPVGSANCGSGCACRSNTYCAKPVACGGDYPLREGGYKAKNCARIMTRKTH